MRILWNKIQRVQLNLKGDVWRTENIEIYSLEEKLT